ncbi:MAG: hypothetical protein ACM3VT_09220 [Solirubrobacterales bacterium]
MTREEQFKRSLLQYNREDCEAVRLLVDRLDQIRRDAASDPTIEFASRPKRHATEAGNAVHGQFERILKSAHGNSAGRGIHLREPSIQEAEASKKPERRKGHQYFRRIVPQASRTISVEPRQRCPRHDVALVPNPKKPVEKTVIDLFFSKSGCRKTITRHVGTKSRCPTCGDRDQYNPPSFRGSQPYAFGHGLQSWAIYQRIVLRLPYEIIVQVMDRLFGIGLCTSTIVGFVVLLSGIA